MCFCVFIGVDPDISKSGVCLYDPSTKDMSLNNLAFFDLLEYLKDKKQKHENILVVIEAGWLNKGNWHIKKGYSANYNATIGGKTYANHEVGKKIVEMCNYLKISCSLVKPKKSKLNSESFKNITKYQKRTNQEQRDAAMLVFGMGDNYKPITKNI